MLEPEMSFCNLDGDMQVAEDYVKYVINYVLNSCSDEIAFFDKHYAEGDDFISTLRSVVDKPFESLDYTEAIEILENSGKKFDHPVSWGIDLQTEHERYLTDEHIKGPVFVINYPKDIKAFYMRANEDGKTVAAMDLLVPRCGELIGGSQREERYDVLEGKMKEHDLSMEDYGWYLDLRKFGTVPHAGFGLGFERLVMYLTEMKNIRDVVPVPRYPGFSKF